MLGLKARATRACFVLFLVKTVCSRNPSLQITRIPAGGSPKGELVQNRDLRVGHCTRNLESFYHIPCKPSGEVTPEKRARGWKLPSCVVEMSSEWISIKLATLTHLISPKSLFQICSFCQRLLYHLALLPLTGGKPSSSALPSAMPYPCAKSQALVADGSPLLLSEKVKDCVFLLKHLQSKS